MKVVNECRIKFEYRLSDGSYIVKKTIFSNMVSTEIIEKTLKVKKEVNRSKATYFDILTYKICIFNIRSITVKNIFLQDDIPKGTRFIENSVKINNEKKRCVNPQKGFYVGNLKKCEKVEVTFKVLALPICSNNPINNCSMIEYDYLYNIEKPPLRLSQNTNSVKTNCENRLFMQVALVNTLKSKECISKIIDVKCKAEIINTKIINVLKLNLCSFLAIGKVEYKILYKTPCSIRCFKDIVGFSSSMPVPVGINYEHKEDIKVDVEYLSTDLIDKNTLYININLLLHY